MTAALRHARRRFVLVGVVLPAAVALASTLGILLCLPGLPSTVAVHWSGERPDGFVDAALYPWLSALCLILVPLLVSWPILRMAPDRWSGVPRAVGAVALGMSGLLSAVAVGSALLQRGLSSPAEAPPAGPVLAVGVLLLVCLGVLGWFLQPDVHVAPPRDAADRPAMAIGAGDRVAWFGTARMGGGSGAALAASVLLLLAISAALLFAGNGAGWISGAVALVVGMLVVATLVFRVRISAAGVVAASPLGWPRVEVPLADITGAEAVDVDPLGEFGGFGMRLGADGRRGVVLRAGTALEVSRRSGHPVVITVDGAAEAAAVVNGLIRAEPTP